MKAIHILCMVFFASAVSAQPVTDDALKEIVFEQKLGATVSIDLPFRDESGRSVLLANYFGKRPVILVLGYYECPMLCTLVLNGMATALQDVPGQMGRDYEVVNVSIDPHEPSALAAAKKKSYVTRFGQTDAAAGWHFLTGDEPAIRKLAAEVGFHYIYDPASRQYAHPSGLVILTPSGKVSRYLLGVVFSAKDLDQSLQSAREAKIGSPVADLVLLCFHYSPFTGKYSSLIMLVVRLTAAGIFIALLAFIVAARRSARTAVAKQV